VKDPTDITTNTYELLGKRYLEGIKDAYPTDMEEFISLILEGGKVLDVGCAGGRDSRVFVDKSFDVTGIDLSETLLGEAKKNVPEATFLKMDAGNLGFPDDSFDAIWANAVVLHIPKNKTAGVLSEFKRVLKPGGKLYVRVKEGRGERLVKDKLSEGNERFFAYFTEYELEELAKKATLNIVKLQAFDDELGREKTKWLSLWLEKPNSEEQRF